MKALITGHEGFVGRHFWRVLEERGYDVTGVDIKSGVDARDYFRHTGQRFDLVVHLAAVVGGRATIEGSPLSVAVDLSIDAEMFQWALCTRPGRVVYYSSSAAYPTRLQDLTLEHALAESDIDLDAVESPDLTYGWAKLTGEILAKHAEEAGVRTHVFRPFSGYGSDQDLDYPFPSFIARGVRRDHPFEVWGDGNQVRDFIHIDDVVAGTMAAVDQDVPGPVNLGWGRATSFNDLAPMVMAAADYSAGILHLPAKPVGVQYRVADPTKMLTFYQPKITLEAGIAAALKEMS